MTSLTEILTSLQQAVQAINNMSTTIKGVLVATSTASTGGGGSSSSTYQPIFYPQNFGAVGNGVTDDTTAMSNWIAAINASTAVSVIGGLGNGSFNINAATLPGGLVISRSNVLIDGQGGTITVTSTQQMNDVFYSVDQSHIHYKQINFNGNNVATGFALGGAIGFLNSAANIQDLLVEDCSFNNFQGDYWIYVETLGAFNNSIQDMKVNRCSFFSQNGNARGPTNIGINSAFVSAIGIGHNSTTPTPNAFVRGVRITNNFMRADYIKTGIQIFNNVQDVYIAGNQIYNAGQLGGIINDVGSYAIMCYENESPATTSYSAHALIENNYIFNVRDNGFYIAGQWLDSVIDGNVVNFQTSTAAGTLPKGGISINGGVGITVANNRLLNIAADGITLLSEPSVYTGSGDGQWIIANNTVTGNLNAGIRLQNTFGSAITKVTIDGNNIEATGTAYGISVEAFSGSVPGSVYSNMRIDNNNINGGTYGIRVFADSGALTFNNGFSVSRNTLSAPGQYGIDISNITAGGPVLLDGNMVSGAATSASYNIGGTTNGIFQNNIVSQQTIGNGWAANGAQGTLRNNSFDRTPNANIVLNSGGQDLGRIKPTWVPAGSGEATVVQQFIPTETGSSGSKYIVNNWVYPIGSAAWLDQRMLTGN